MQIYYRYLLLLFCCCSTILLSAQSVHPQKVLFVGNSYTYFWNLPQTVQAMAAEKKLQLITRQSTAGGAHWGHHWRGERELETLQVIENGDFDAVVLQNHSLSTIERLDSMQFFGAKLAERIKNKQADIYLYMTWAREWNPYMQEKITEGYRKLAKQLKASIVPVGPAWERARQLRPGFPLYDPDGSHPSAMGTYLTACVFFGVLTQQSPVGLPNRLISQDKDGEKLYLTIQKAEDVAFCQRVAEEILSQW